MCWSTLTEQSSFMVCPGPPSPIPGKTLGHCHLQGYKESCAANPDSLCFIEDLPNLLKDWQDSCEQLIEPVLTETLLGTPTGLDILVLPLRKKSGSEGDRKNRIHWPLWCAKVLSSGTNFSLVIIHSNQELSVTLLICKLQKYKENRQIISLEKMA